MNPSNEPEESHESKEAGGAPEILAVLARVFVDDLETAMPVYQSLAREEGVRFGFRETDLARVGPFLLLSGNAEAYRNRVATLLVRDLDPVLDVITSNGGKALEGPFEAPNGRRLVALHPDGSVFEYIESAEGKSAR